MVYWWCLLALLKCKVSWWSIEMKICFASIWRMARRHRRAEMLDKVHFYCLSTTIYDFMWWVPEKSTFSQNSNELIKFQLNNKITVEPALALSCSSSIVKNTLKKSWIWKSLNGRLSQIVSDSATSNKLVSCVQSPLLVVIKYERGALHGFLN